MPRIIPRTIPVTGYKHFLTPLRRLIFDYDPLSPSQSGVRAYLRKPLISMAEANPDVEVLVRKLRRGKAAVLRGHYGRSFVLGGLGCDRFLTEIPVNGRDKVICVNKMEANQVEKKVRRKVMATRMEANKPRLSYYSTHLEQRSSH